MSFKDKVVDFFSNIKDKEFEDFFPLNNQSPSMNNVLKIVGIYVGIIVAVCLVIVLLGWIPVLGILLKIAGALAALYSVIGMGHILFKYMKFN